MKRILSFLLCVSMALFLLPGQALALDAEGIDPDDSTECSVSTDEAFVDALDHIYNTDWSKDANNHWHTCSVCGDKKDIAAHDYGAQGDQCVVCKYERSHVHRLTLVPKVDATCTTDGNQAYNICSGCDDWFEDDAGNITITDHDSVIIQTNGLAGKTISILGDSISTYTGVSNNAAYNATLSGGEIYYTEGKLGVYQKDTWWQQAIDTLGLELTVNNSWSGSCIFNTRAGTVGAYVDRSVQLHNTQGEEPDMIAVYLGTNDFCNYKSTLGTSADIDYVSLITETEAGYTYAAPTTAAEAYAIMLHKATVRYPDSEIYCFTLLPQRISNADVKRLEQFNQTLLEIAEHFGAYGVDLYHNSGIKYDDNFATFVADNALHPGPAGMDAITGCFISSILENSKYVAADVHSITYDLDNVIVDQGTAYAIMDGDAFSCTLTAPAGYDLSVSVTMGSTDITASCYANGKITISSVTADIAIAASASLPVKEAEKYRWEFNGSDLSPVTTGNNTPNALTRLEGSMKDGVHTHSRFQMSENVVLYHDRPWTIEWKSAGTWTDTTDGALLFAGATTSNTADTPYIYRRHKSDFIAIGVYTGGQYHNYGVALSTSGIDATIDHVYRMENRVAADSTNMVYLYVDGVEIGPMNHHWIGGTDQNETVDWVNGRDFVFSYMGTTPHTIGNCSINYIQVIECVHTYKNSTVTAPTCTEQGYTTYTCACGDSYVDDYTDAAGHSYVNGVCTVCNKAQSGSGEAVKKPYTTEWERFKVQANQAPYIWETTITEQIGVADQMTWTEGYQMIAQQTNASYGKPYASSTGRQYSNNVPIPDGYTHLRLTMLKSAASESTGGLVFFDANDRPIAGYYIAGADADGVELKTYAIPSGSEYFVTSIWMADSEKYPYDIGNFECYFVKGETVGKPDPEKEHYEPVTGVIALPESYTADGEPTKLIMFAHGGHGYVDETHWYPTNADMETTVQALLDAGYAVFDCNGYKDTPYDEWVALTNAGNVQMGIGLPQVVEAYYNCYQYILDNYNIMPGLYIQGCSQGGHTALTFAKMHPEDVAAVAWMAGHIELYDQGYGYQTLENKRQVAKLLGFSNTTFTTNAEALAAYEHDKADPFDPMKWITTVDGTDYLYDWTVPIKFFYGTTDTILPQYQYVKRFHQALNNAGFSCELKWYEGFSHHDVATAANEIARNDMIAWFNDPHTCSYESVTTEPTCTEQGYTTHTCSRCGDSYVDAYVDALGHKTELRNAKEATCTEAGYTGDEICTVCGKTVKQGKEIPALGHNYEAVVTEPTCTEQGYTTHTCTRCNHSYVDAYMDALGHTWDEWHVTTAPGYETAGEETQHCTRCGVTNTRPLSSLKDQILEQQIQVYIEDGKTVYKMTVPGSITVLLATYSTQGQMRTVAFLTAGKGTIDEQRAIQFSLPEDGGPAARLFFLKPDYLPLCAKKNL